MGNCLKLHRGATWADGHEWEEYEEKEAYKDTATATVGKKTERVEVKIRVTKRQLQELLEKSGSRDGKVRQVEVEKVLAELMTSGVVCSHHQQHDDDIMKGQWRPSLYSIPEAVEEF